MKKLSSLILIILFGASAFAQPVSDIDRLAPQPDMLNVFFEPEALYKLCGTKKVKMMRYFDVDERGDTDLTVIARFNNSGKITGAVSKDLVIPRVYYSYHGDSVIKQSVGFYLGYAGVGPEPLVIQVNIFNKEGQKIFSSYDKITDWADSLKMPASGTNYIYENGLLKTAGSSTYTYDEHKNLIETTTEGKTEKWRRVYDGNNLMEVYSTVNINPELLFEKFAYDAAGKINSFESYNSKGILYHTYKLKFDAANRLVSDTYDCNGDVFAYDVTGNLLSASDYSCDKTTPYLVYKYNTKGLPASIKNNNNKGTTYFSYTYWP